MISSSRPIGAPDVARHYDELDLFYRQIWGEHVHHGLWLHGDESPARAVRQLVEVTAREAAIGPGTRVIDIGCGYGATARWLAAELGACVTAITLSEVQHAIAIARNEGKDNPTVLLGDWLENRLPAGSFDSAIAVESSEHMTDKALFFEQARRVLAPGGRLAVCAWLSAERPTTRQVRWLIEPICREGRVPHLASESDYLRLAGAAGFTAVRVQDVTHQVTRTWTVILRVFLYQALRRPEYARVLLDRRVSNRVFALTIVRLWFAFRSGALRYGIFTFARGTAER